MAAKDKIRVDDPDYYAKLGARGGKKPTRGYFGYLKDTGQSQRLAALGAAGGYAKAAKSRGDEQREDVLRGPAEAGQEKAEDQDQAEG